MNIISLPLLCLVSLTLAEPPVGDGYPAARSSDRHHNDHNDHHDHVDPSQQYGSPSSAARNSISTEYGAPNMRNSHHNRGHKSVPSVRNSNNQRHSSAASRSSSQRQNLTDNAEQTYATPNARTGVSNQYGTPESRSLSDNYGVPAASRSLSENSGAKPEKAYDAPVTRGSQKYSSSFRNQNSLLAQDYSMSKSHFQTDSNSRSKTLARSNNVDYEAPNSYSKSSDSENLSPSYGAPKNAPSSTYDAASRSKSAHDTPSARNSDSESLVHNSTPNSYTAPNERDLSETYGASNARSLSQEHGVPSSRSNLRSDGVGSSYTQSSRSSPSSSYLPAARDASPSQQYGVPERGSQGYENARARALEELLNQEPASYDFSYQIEDQESGNEFGHSETRQDNRAHGSYFVVYPDGTKHTVEYEADEGGFKPRISVEPAPRGYDDNAQELARSQGPY